MHRPKTIFCDLDGTLVKHSNPIDTQNPNLILEVLPGVHEKLKDWDMKGYTIIIIAISAINANLFAAEAGMPQLDPKYWFSQAFWLILFFSILYISISKIYLPKIKDNLDNRENKVKDDLDDAHKFKELSDEKYKEVIKYIDYLLANPD